MKKRQIVIGFLVLVSIVGLAAADDLPYKEGEVLVRFANPNIDKSTKNSILDSIFGCSCSPVAKEYSIVPGLTLVKLPAGVTVEAAQSSLNQSPDILYAEPNYKRQLAAIPNDQRFGELWGMHNIGQTGGTAGADVNAPEAWEIHTGSSDIIVAVTDTGVDYNHPDLMGNMWVNTAELNGTPGVDDDGNGYIDDIYGYDFGDNDSDPMDDAPFIAGHGTHVSGTIGAVGNNGIGVAGVCWDVGIMACKIADANGDLVNAAIISSIQYAINNGADVINASWGGYYYSQADYDVIRAAGNAGVLFVAAAGNEAWDNDSFLPHYPSSYNLDNIIAVMATDHDDLRSIWWPGFSESNYGAGSVDLAAPGSGILSCFPGGGYVQMGGTSMACPHVAGACALMWSLDPSLSYLEIKDLLLLTADKIPALEDLCVTEGRLNLHRALENIITDTLAPLPDPAEWSVIKSVVIGEPKETGRFTIVMEAQEATDKSDVQYYFEEISGEPNSGWQNERLCIFTGLTENTTYTFHVKARDLSENFNETEWSVEHSATTDDLADTSSPWPDPSQWAMEPRKFATGIIGMEAKTSYDENGPVKYKFECTTHPGHTRDWTDPDCNNPMYMISGLSYDTYTFTVQARDALGNPTTVSTPPVSVTLAPPPRTLYVPSVSYPTIQSALDDAHDGDTVVILPGTYVGRGFVVSNDITITGTAPSNPGVVATTIIDCTGEVGPAFELYGGMTTGICALKGITIQDLFMHPPDALNGGDPGDPGYNGGSLFGGAIYIDGNHIVENCVIRNCHLWAGNAGDGAEGEEGDPGDPLDPNDDVPPIVKGGDGGTGGNAAGAGIFVWWGNPTIKGCIIEDCTVRAGDGGFGAPGLDADDADPPDPNISPGGPGGDGGNAGWASGAGIHIDFIASATVEDTIIRNCSAFGGSAGDGGDGGNDADPALAVDPNVIGAGDGSGGHGGVPGPVLGAGVFCDWTMTQMRFTNCAFIGNKAYGGYGGDGGDAGDSDPYIVVFPGGIGGLIELHDADPCSPQGLVPSEEYSAKGGGVCVESAGMASFNGCTFMNNITRGSVSGLGGLNSLGYRHRPFKNYPIQSFGAGAACGSMTTTGFTNCEIKTNKTIVDANQFSGLQWPFYEDQYPYGEHPDPGFNLAFGHQYTGVGGGMHFDGGLSGAYTELNNCQIVDNYAPIGGGVGAEGVDDFHVNGSDFVGNTAIFGGGAIWSDSDADFTNCEVSGNMATGDGTFCSGAGLYSQNSTSLIQNCLITENTADGSGGAISVVGPPRTGGAQRIINCLITDNTAVLDGAGILSSGGAEPLISNCTIAGNEAVGFDSFGGGVSCYDAFVGVVDSILWGNDADDGGQIAIGDPLEPDNPASTVMLYYSDIMDGADGVFVGDSFDPWEGPWLYLPYPASVIEDNPLFAVTSETETNNNYYLSQVAAGQLEPNSPCVDWGSVEANDPDIGMDLYTTRTDLGIDVGFVDLGYHYSIGMLVPKYQLRIEVVDDGSGTHGSLSATGSGSDPFSIKDPNSRMVQQGTVVDLIADPDPNYRVKVWTGTDNDGSASNNNTVIMNRNRTVYVEFKRGVIRLYVPGEYPTIADAVVAAGNGDIIILSQGTHFVSDTDGIDFGGKSIILQSEDPNDPAVVASTIIDCQGDRYVPHRAFWFHNGEDANAVIAGVTIANGYTVGALGLNYAYSEGPWPPGQEPPAPPRANSGTDASGDGYGGAILCENGSSPTIENCVIRNCIVTGGQGGDGANGYYVPTGSDADGQSGGNGGDGEGNGYGGAIACLDGSSPIIRNCTIKDNFARGGCGGDGGDGSIMDGTGNESWGGDGGHALGDGKGGAIYCDGGSNPVVTDCNFSDSVATSGIPGIGGQKGGGDSWPEPWDEATDGDDGVTESYGGIAGGAAYFDEDSDANFNNCTFTGNKACEYSLTTEYTYLYTEGIPVYSYTRGGALYSAADNAVFVNDCNFTANLGGAVYCGADSVLDFNDCLFEDNSYRSEYPPEFLVGGGPVDFGIINPDLIYFYLQFGIDLGFIIDCNGGAIHINPDSDVSIVDCTFSGNSAYTNGGALYCDSDANIVNCSFSGNEAGNNGGAVEAYLDTGDPATKKVLTLNFKDCSFAGNEASVWGGGVYFKDIIADFNDCYFVQNTAQSGGGLFVSSSDITITGGVVQQNKSTGGDGLEMGGGLACIDSDATIRDVTIVGNRAEGNDGSGGAINFYGGWVTHKLKNCLFTENYAKRGGAVSCSLWATPDIDNCTFSDNYAGSMGGAVLAETGALPRMSDCIFTRSTKHAIYEKDGGGNAEVEFSLFYDNAGGDYYDSGTGLTYTGASEVGSIPDGAFNLYGNPWFASGALGGFYLNQSLSPAVNAGSDTAANLGLDSYTTDPLNVPDAGQVDIGYHYRVSSTLAQFQLTATVAGGQGTIEPPFGIYYAGTVVKLTATPGTGYLIAGWFGTVNDKSESTTNYVVMNSDKDVWVEFKQPKTLLVSVGGGQPGSYSGIQDALFDAEDGDIIVVYTGTYYGPTLWVNKSVTIQSEHPDDPSYVAATILDGTGYGNPGIVFRQGTSTVLNGFTLQNFRWSTGFGLDGSRGLDHPNGFDGGWSAGGAIFINAKASPTIKNCVIRDNWIWGGNGGDGVTATTTENAGRGGWGGAALGGAIYCGWYSSPTFINCQILDNTARGGNGGDGGDEVIPGGTANYGGNWSVAEWWYYDPDSLFAYWSIGDLYEVFVADPTAGGLEWSWYFQEALLWYYDWNDPDTWERPATGYLRDYRWYSAYGGGVFCQEYSNVSFIDCVIGGNLAQGGMSGVGGERNGENPEPEYSYELPTFGGGVYCAANSKITFSGCTLGENVATEPELADMNDPASGQRYRLDPYVGHGGGICAENTATVIITDCNFVGNEAQVGGGMHWADANAIIVDSNFAYNTAYHGGGMFGEHGLATILGCEITNNDAVNSDVNVVVIGEGGGLHFWALGADIFDCNISNNQADGAGGGAYFGGENAPMLHNCLIAGNTSGRDGGGVSANMFAQPTIFNCTIADNAVTGEGFEAAYGGGLSCSYGSSTEVINSILWGNNISGGFVGSQIAISAGFEYGQMPADVNVSYSDVQDGAANVFVDTGCTLYWDYASNLTGTSASNPEFVTGGLGGGYYLSQIAAGESSDSPCVDEGDGEANSLILGRYRYTTRTNNGSDLNEIDMGYHYYKSGKFTKGDITYDGGVDGNDMALLISYWLWECSFPGWCEGSDLNQDGIVNFIDQAILATLYGTGDIEAPVPNPSRWHLVPHSTGTDVIEMTARQSADNSGWPVYYYFECTTHADCNSNWQVELNYIANALTTNDEYGFRVKARDTSYNETGWSHIGYAIAGEIVDVTPPSPAPMSWSVWPEAISSSSVYMESVTASDVSGVEYFFEETTGGGHSSEWQDGTVYTDTGLDPNTLYGYRVKARDKSPNQNETGWSIEAGIVTPAPGVEPNEPNEPTGCYDDGSAPAPNPYLDPNLSYMGYDDGNNVYFHHLESSIVEDVNGGCEVEYFFQCYTNTDFNSGWQTSNVYQDDVSSYPANHYWRVKARDPFRETPWSGFLMPD